MRKCAILTCNRCPLKCEVRRETYGQNALKILRCKGVELENLLEATKNHKKISIYVCFIPEADIPMLGIQMTQSMAFDQYTVDP
jgi:hypothetical protein